MPSAVEHSQPEMPPTETTQRVSIKRPRVLDGGADAASLSSVACKRCRSRKVKCGGEFPSCLGCVKADVPCVIADATSPRDYTRAEVHQLQQKLRRLESAVARPAGAAEPRRVSQDGRLADGSDTDPTTSHLETPRFVGPENGVGFFLSRLTAYQEGQANGPVAPQLQPSSIVYHPPHPLPPRHVALSAVEEYFREFHVAHPILDPTRIYAALDELPSLASSTSRENKDKLFQLNIVLAIGSVRLFRNKLLNLHPFGFFTAALEASPPSAFSFSTLDDIENILLIAHFGVYFNIGCSLWELGRLCIRVAVELGLHCRQPVPPPSGAPVDIQRCRKIFWESYLLDRFSSSTLGRPFAIGDSAISADLPEDAVSVHMPADQNLESHVGPRPKISIFNWLVGLGQLTSQIHYTMNRRCGRGVGSAGTLLVPLPGRAVKTGDTLSLLRKFHGQLSDWRKMAPCSQFPRYVYEASEFFDLSYHETRLWLIRAAIGKLSSGAGMPPRSLLQPCLQSAHNIITSFDSLRRRNLITFTRAYTHLVFVAGIVVVFMLNTQVRQQALESESAPEIDIEHWLSDLDDGSRNPTSEEIWSALSTAGDILTWFAEGMPDVAVYTRFFHDLKRGLQRMQGENQTRDPGCQGRETPGRMSSQFSTGQLSQMEPCFGSQSTYDQHEIPGFCHLAPTEQGSVEQFVPMDPFFQSMDSFPDITHEAGGQGYYNGGHNFGAFSWPFWDILGIEGVDASMSGYIWDTMIPWQGSPCLSMESRTSQ